MKDCTEMVVNWMVRHNAINEKEKELYKYALHSALLLIMPLLLAGSIGYCLGNIRNGIMLVVPFMLLRKFSGGYHAKSFFHCLLESGLTLFLCIMLTTKINFDWKLSVATAIASLSLLIFSPIEHENRRLDNEERHNYKKMVIRLLCIVDLLGIILFLIQQDEAAVCICIGVQMTAALQIPCIIKKLTITKKGQ